MSEKRIARRRIATIDRGDVMRFFVSSVKFWRLIRMAQWLRILNFYLPFALCYTEPEG